MFQLMLLVLIGAFIQLVKSANSTAANQPQGNCTSADAAAQCNNYYKCCNKNGVCGTNLDSCYPENGGIPYSGHCYYLQANGTCTSCCFLTVQKHYCGTQQDCDAAIRIYNIIRAVTSTYGCLIGLCFVVGIYRRYKTKQLKQQILERSMRFDQEKTRHNGQEVLTIIKT